MTKLTMLNLTVYVKSGSRGCVGDGGNLYFKYSEDGNASWIFRYKFAGKSRDMGLGKYPDLRLPAARAKALEARLLLNSGTDPIVARDAAQEALKASERAAEAKRHTFKASLLIITRLIVRTILRSGGRVGSARRKRMFFHSLVISPPRPLMWIMC